MKDEMSSTEIIRFKSLESTNDEARKIISNLSPKKPVWIIADKQTKGRGRGQNMWVSEIGNIYCSVALPILFDTKLLPLLSCSSSIAVFDCVKKYLPNTEKLKIKWPNDILLNDSKLSGILIENIITNVKNYSIVGIGINVAHSPKNLSHETICLNNICERKVDLEDVIVSLVKSFNKNLLHIYKNDADFLINKFKNNSWRYQKNIEFKLNDKVIEGKIVDFTNDFEIMVQTDKKTEVFNSGEVSFNY